MPKVSKLKVSKQNIKLATGKSNLAESVKEIKETVDSIYLSKCGFEDIFFDKL